ncbi:NUDIX hydrolase [Salinibacterium sp. SWN167]|uniref:NUDIX hydrolase n=1 Tax=Salinibacterium sp. SWN167 TaxID=2792054 RepID=UPI0018CEC951|nr:NUDIX hydrolase [Salinibacterium sp. SWN167]MBH0081963.1 NUDIX hydrolase [Salinibacterium sp. SWN167]
MEIYRDSHDRALTDYPRPSVAVDTAVLTVPPGGELSALLVRAGAGVGTGTGTGTGTAWRLPGTFLHEGELLADAVLRSLRTKAGVSGLSPRQLHVFDDPARDNRGWVLSVAHLDVVPWPSLTIDESLAKVVPVADAGALPYGHNDILDQAVATLRTRYAAAPDPAGLLEHPFTLRQLQHLHETVAGEPLMRDSFRRAMEPQLAATGELAAGTVGKPARLFSGA